MSGDCCRSHFLLHTTVPFNSTLNAQTVTQKKRLSEAHLWKYIKIFVHLQLPPCEQNSFIALSLFELHNRALITITKKCRTLHFPFPHNGFRYKFRRGDPPQHSVCCPLNRTIIMKTVTLAVLLLLAVASMVSGDPLPMPIPGKSRYGHETCLFVIDVFA